jgi:two-component system, OmpR family, response regulator VicR
MSELILLVEDDQSISEMVSRHLKKEGYRVVTAFEGGEAIRIFFEDAFDMVILDLMLPGADGLDILQRIRQKSWIPVLIMSAKGSDVDKALGLGFGADDYMAKPFSLIEMTARVKAALRRAKLYSQENPQINDRTIRIFNLVIDPDNFSVLKNGREINLTAKEFHILRLLTTHPNQVFTKAQLYEHVWNDSYYGDENVINVHIRRLREKIEDDPSTPRCIKTLWGIGYKLGDQ